MDGRSRARSRVVVLMSAWIAGDYGTVSRGCASDVRWWTPVSAEPVSGRVDALAELERVLGPVPRPIDVTAVVLDRDGTRCVVEMRAEGGKSGTPSFITTVLTLRDGQVSAGRTYVATRAAEYADVATA